MTVSEINEILEQTNWNWEYNYETRIWRLDPSGFSVWVTCKTPEQVILVLKEYDLI